MTEDRSFNAQIDEKTPKTYLDRLDYSLGTPGERVELVRRLLEGKSFFSEYLDECYNPNLSQDDYTSDQNNVCRALERMADYLLMGGFSLDDDRRRGRVVGLGEAGRLDADAETADNCYKSNALRLEPGDLRDPELAPWMGEYARFKRWLERRRDRHPKEKYRIDRLIGELNRDMLVLKEQRKRPVRLKGCGGAPEPVHWEECDYQDEEQVRELLLVGPRKMTGALGVLSWDMERLLREAPLTGTERRVVGYLRRNPDVTQARAAAHFKLSQPYIPLIVANAARKIAEYCRCIEEQI